jgi:hypothetical protein
MILMMPGSSETVIMAGKMPSTNGIDSKTGSR